MTRLEEVLKITLEVARQDLDYLASHTIYDIWDIPEELSEKDKAELQDELNAQVRQKEAVVITLEKVLRDAKK